MKKVTVLAVLLVVATLPAFALGPSLGFGVQANYASLNFLGPLSDVYGPGYGGGAHLDIGLTVLTLRVSADYMRFSPDNDKMKTAIGSVANVSVDGGTINIFSGNANLRWDVLPLPVLSPYVTGGVGMAKLSMTDVTVKVTGLPDQTVAGSSTDVQTTANIGAGVNLNFGVSLFLEAKYTWIFENGGTSTYVPVTLGITF